MRKLNLILVLSLLFVQSSLWATTDPEPSGNLGDNFSLEGALEMFKQSTSPEDFEKRINTEKNYVNNLDLDEDGKVDYIRVEDHMEKDVHAIVLQVAVSEKEIQDIAVIEIEKTGNDRAILQIVGDETLYGEEVLVEPFEEKGTSNGQGGPSADYDVHRVVVNVWGWPCVRFIFAPRYIVWVSPWRWHYYPRYWVAWHPHPYHIHYNHRVHYHRHYHVVRTHRVVHAHRVYTPRRKSSAIVQTRVRNTKVVKTQNGKVVKSQTTTTRTTAKKTTRPVTKSQAAPVKQKRTTTVKKTRPQTKTTTVKKTGPKKQSTRPAAPKTTKTKVTKTRTVPSKSKKPTTVKKSRTKTTRAKPNISKKGKRH